MLELILFLEQAARRARSTSQQPPARRLPRHRHDLPELRGAAAVVSHDGSSRSRSARLPGYRWLANGQSALARPAAATCTGADRCSSPGPSEWGRDRGPVPDVPAGARAARARLLALVPAPGHVPGAPSIPTTRTSRAFAGATALDAEGRVAADGARARRRRPHARPPATTSTSTLAGEQLDGRAYVDHARRPASAARRTTRPLRAAVELLDARDRLPRHRATRSKAFLERGRAPRRRASSSGSVSPIAWSRRPIRSSTRSEPEVPRAEARAGEDRDGLRRRPRDRLGQLPPQLLRRGVRRSARGGRGAFSGCIAFGLERWLRAVLDTLRAGPCRLARRLPPRQVQRDGHRPRHRRRRLPRPAARASACCESTASDLILAVRAARRRRSWPRSSAGLAAHARRRRGPRALRVRRPRRRRRPSPASIRRASTRDRPLRRGHPLQRRRRDGRSASTSTARAGCSRSPGAARSSNGSSCW